MDADTKLEQRRAYKRAWAERNREKKKAADRACYEANKAEILARSKAHREANPEKYRAYSAKYRAANLEQERKRCREIRAENKERSMWQAAKSRAKAKGLDFDIEVSDVVIPATCPYLNIPITASTNALTANSPTLDRIDSSRGYVKGNVVVCSHRGNTLKNNSVPDELELVARNHRQLLAQQKKAA